VPKPFDADTIYGSPGSAGGLLRRIYIDRGPGWRLFWLVKKFWLWTGLAGQNPADLVPADALLTVEAGKLADSGDDSLPGTSGCADRFYQRPVFILFSGNLLVMAA